MSNSKAYSTVAATSPLAPVSIPRRETGPKDVHIQILFCGVCHTDLHISRNEWGGTTYPCVPGHEIVGRVIKTGAEVKHFKEGDLAAVGCMVDSCRCCENCRDGFEQFCESGTIFTYNSPDKHLGGMTYGGYSEHVVVDEAFVLRVPENLDLAACAPLLCAGITTYSPLRHHNVGKGQKVGIVGLGGLGHMGVKLGAAMGATVTVLSQSLKKMEDGLRLGASSYYATSDRDTFRTLRGSFDLILNTVSANLKLGAYLNLLDVDGTLVELGIPEHPMEVPAFALALARRSLSGSNIGGIAETQEMLDFCAERNVTPEIEVIEPGYINEAYDRVLASDVRYRFVIDMSTL